MSEAIPPKTALVTGAAKRIGHEIALFLAREGWDVVVHYHRSEAEAQATVAEIRRLGRKAGLVCADLSDARAAATVIERAHAEMGALSLLVHNAALFEKQDLASFTHESFATQMAVNLEAPLHLTRDFVEQAPTGSNVVCLLDGMQGWSMSSAYLAYALSKRGLETSIGLLARSLAPQVRMNGIALGASLAGIDTPEMFARLAQEAPLQRTNNVSEILCALAFILASGGLTGQVIDIANGVGAPALFASESREKPSSVA